MNIEKPNGWIVTVDSLYIGPFVNVQTAADYSLKNGGGGRIHPLHVADGCVPSTGRFSDPFFIENKAKSR